MDTSPSPADPPSVRVVPFGEGAVLVDLAIEAAPDRAARTHAAKEALCARLPGADVVVGAGTVLVIGAGLAEVLAIAGGGALNPSVHTVSDRIHRIQAVYDGPDLEPAAEALGLSPEGLRALHTDREVLVELLGFLPGFGYLGPIDPRLVLPRRPSPRPRVPAGSVGIAGAFTGIYPFTSPGGWNLIARAVNAVLFDPTRDSPSLFQPGDRVRFEPVSSADVPPSPALMPREASPRPSRGLRIIAAQPGTTIQDAGRYGQQCRGLPPSGALDPEALARANAAVGNAEGAAAIEIPLGALEVEAEGALVISIDGAAATRLRAGERCRVPACARAARYLAVQGSIDVPVVLGARATLLAVKLGGFQGRSLARGDVVAVGEEGEGRVAKANPMPDAASDEALIVDPGPHVDRFPEGALEVLLSTEWRVSRLGDRVGVRLEGGQIPRDRPDLALPVPMRRGAMQVSTDGTPIVLGPDHPATGGYPVLAVLRAGAQAALGRRRPGDGVRFRVG